MQHSVRCTSRANERVTGVHGASGIDDSALGVASASVSALVDGFALDSDVFEDPLAIDEFSGVIVGIDCTKALFVHDDAVPVA